MSSNPPVWVNVYVDGFNLYHAIADLDVPALKWLDLIKLGRGLLRPGECLGQVHLFTAIVSWDAGKAQRHRAYLAAQEAVGVLVSLSSFRKQARYCFEQDRTCKFREEKQTDVAIAVTLIRDGLAGRFDRAILVTADTDQIPTVRAFREDCPDRTLSLLLPPGRGHDSRALTGLFDARERTQLTAGRLRRCLLPRTVRDPSGRVAATRPAAYDPVRPD